MSKSKSLSSVHALAQSLELGLDRLYVIVGEEPLLAMEAADLIQNKCKASGFTERKVLTQEPGFDWGSLLVAVGTPSLFGDRELIVFRMPTGKPGVEGAKTLETFVGQLHDDLVVLIELPALEFATAKAKWFQTLTAHSTTVELRRVSRDRLPAFIQSRLKAQGQSLSAEGIQFLGEKVEGNLLAAHQEIQKLALLFPEGPIPDQGLKEAVMDVARFDLDDLSDALMKKDIARYQRALTGLMDSGEALPLIVWSLAETLRGAIKALQSRAQGRSLPEALREARVWGPRQALLEATLSLHSLNKTTHALKRLAAVDRSAKGMEYKQDPWGLLRQLGIEFFGKA